MRTKAWFPVLGMLLAAGLFPAFYMQYTQLGAVTVRAHAPGSVTGEDGCAWDYHPGVSLGTLHGTWAPCAAEGQMCSCDTLTRWEKEYRAGAARRPRGVYRCTAESADADWGDSGSKDGVCTCLQVMEVGFAAAEQECRKIGDGCTGVSCVAYGADGGKTWCTPRGGAGYLAPAAHTDSWTKDCTSAADRPGGGLQGKHRVDGHATIFISMAAFRDADVAHTLRDLFAKAAVPARVFVGLVCQDYPSDPACMPADGEWGVECNTKAGFCPQDQIRLRHFAASEAQGPTHARAVAASLYRNEDFFFMMDAHNRFVDDWDTKIVEHWSRCPSEKCVLSVYPQGFDYADPLHPRPLGTKPGASLNKHPIVAFLCNGQFHDRALIKNAQAISIRENAYPRPTAYSGAGLLFGPGSMILDAPFDPHLPYLWDGEEFLYTARLWTWGYDLYSPGINILFHYYSRPNAPRVWSEKTYSQNGGHTLQSQSYQRLQYILKATKPNSTEPMVDPATAGEHVTRELPKYGLGPHRTIDQYWRFARIDATARTGDAQKGSQGYFCRTYTRTGRHEYPPIPDP